MLVFDFFLSGFPVIVSFTNNFQKYFNIHSDSVVERKSQKTTHTKKKKTAFHSVVFFGVYFMTFQVYFTHFETSEAQSEDFWKNTWQTIGKTWLVSLLRPNSLLWGTECFRGSILSHSAKGQSCENVFVAFWCSIYVYTHPAWQLYQLIHAIIVHIYSFFALLVAMDAKRFIFLNVCKSNGHILEHHSSHTHWDNPYI